MAVDKNAVIKEAQKFAAKGQFDKAILEWRKLLKDFPSDSSIFNTIGDLCLKKGDKGKAEAVEAYYRAGTILAAEGFTSKAIAIYKKVLNIDPNKIEVHLALGDMNAEKGLVGNALESYKLAADHYLHNKEIRKALPVYQRMADLNPANASFRLKLADMYAREGMKKEAITAYLLASDVHIEKKAYKEARQIFEKALALDPNNREVYHKAGDLYFREGKFVEACKALKPVFDGDPSNEEVCSLYLDALAKAGRENEAEDVYRKLLEKDAGRADLREKLYRLYLAKKDYDKALGEASVLANAKAESKDFDAAADILKGFCADAPDHIEGRCKLSDLYKSMGKGPEAAAELVKAARTLINNGDQEGAKSLLGQAVGLAPAMAEAKRLLDSLQAPPAAPKPEPAPVPPPQRPVKPPVVEQAPIIEEAPSVIPLAAARAFEEDPAIAEAFTEVDVLVKYGMAGKALEQLEGVAQKYPESLQVRARLRDLYREQGNGRKAAEHSISLADLYAGRGMQERVEPLLREALELDPNNSAARARLGIAPAAAAAFSPVRTEAPAIELPAAVETPAIELTGAEEAPVFEQPSPPEEQPADFMTTLDMAPFEPLEEFPAPEAAGGQPFGEAPAKEPPAEFTFEEPAAPAAPEEELPPAEEAAAPPAPEEGFVEQPVQPEAPLQAAPAREAAPEEIDLSEVWAEAEFYYQQGLFDEAKKHYAKIIQYNPGDKRAIDRLTEISREAEETQEFSKLAEAVDELEGLAPAESESGLAESASDEEAVRSLMQEIAALNQKQQPAPPPPPPVYEEPAAAEPPQPPAPPAAGSEGAPAGREPDDEAVRLLMQEIAALKKEQQKQAVRPPAYEEKEISAPKPGPVWPAHAGQPRTEEDFFDLGEELRGETAAAPGGPGETRAPSEDFFDLASELRDELSSVVVPESQSPAAEDQSLDDIFEEFKKGVEKQSVKEDADTHYNLGVAYKEMGLLDDAVAEFILTPEDEPKFIQSRHMLGLCYMEKGEYQNAVAEIRHALSAAEEAGASAGIVGMRYDLGLAYQGTGNINDALQEFQKVCEADPGYRDAAGKMKELQGGSISLARLKSDIEKEVTSKFLEEGERIEREEKTRKNEKVRG